MIYDDRLTIETPEQIALDYEIAGLGGRFVAALVDHIVIGVLIVLLGALLQSILGLDGQATQPLLGLVGISIYLVLCGYYIVFETFWNGQTPGKRLLGLRVVRSGGRPIGFLGSVIRNIIRLADFLPALYGVGMISMFIDRNTRRLGDFAAGSLTVKDQRNLSLQTLLPMPVQLAGPIAEQLTIPHLDVITLADYQLVQEYLASRMLLASEDRRRLAGQLLQGLQQRLGYPIYGDPESFLLRFVSEYNALHRQRPTPQTQQIAGAPPAR